MNRTERWLVATTEYAGLTAYSGGIGTHYAALLPALAESASVDLAVFGGGAPVDGADVGDVRLVHYSGEGEGLALPRRAAIVRELFRRGGYDRVFLPEWGALGAGLPRSAPLLTNLATSARLAHEIAGVEIEELPRDRRSRVRQQVRLETSQIRRSAGLIAISRAMHARTAAAIDPLPPVEVVANCIDVRRVERDSRTAALPPGWPPGDGPIVLFLGRSERRKGVEDAATAFGQVVAEHRTARLVFAGAGGDSRFEPTRQALAARVPRAYRDRMTWLGHVAGGGLYRAISAADVVACPSRWEGFGQVALEAKAIGTPLIATSGSGFDDFCVDGEDCLLVPPADPSRLAGAIARVIDDPDAARLRAERARTRVRAFAPQPIARALRHAADRLLGAATLQ